MNQQNDKQQAALDALRTLESYGYKEREVKIGDVKIVLAPLTTGEIIEVFEMSGKYEDTDASVQKMKVDTVARSIIQVNDVVLNPIGQLSDKVRIVSSFGDELVDVLFDEYCILDNLIKAAAIKRHVGEKLTDAVESATANEPTDATKG